MNDLWAAEVVGRLHRLDISQKKFAKLCGYTPSYLSMLLNGKKTFSSEYSKKLTRRSIFKALERLEYDAKRESEAKNC